VGTACGKIFRTATVTQEGLHRPSTTNSGCSEPPDGRNSDGYRPENVLGTKSAFLRERSLGLELHIVDGLVPGLVPRPVLGACQPSPDVVDNHPQGEPPCAASDALPQRVGIDDRYL
jgi:hypothetical protein